MPKGFVKYSSNLSKKSFLYLFVFVLTIFNLITIIVFCRLLISLPSSDAEPSDIVILFLVPSLITLFISSFIMYFSNFEPDIQVSEQGLKVQTFWFWWIFIPWEDVKEIKVPLFGLSRSHLIIVRKLTVIHRIIGIAGGTFFKPAFLVSPKLERYSELVSTIKDNYGKSSS